MKEINIVCTWRLGSVYIRRVLDRLLKRKESHNLFYRKFEDFQVSRTYLELTQMFEFPSLFFDFAVESLIRLSHEIERGTAAQVSLRRTRSAGCWYLETRTMGE